MTSFDATMHHLADGFLEGATQGIDDAPMPLRDALRDAFNCGCQAGFHLGRTVPATEIPTPETGVYHAHPARL